MRYSKQIRLALLLPVAVGYPSIAQWIATSEFGSDIFIYLGVFVFGIALLAIPILLVRFAFGQEYLHNLSLIAFTTLFVLCYFIGLPLGMKVRMAAMHNLAERCKPLVAAIRQYERDHSSPPDSLENLQPDYLSSVPTTGMRAYPNYKYHTGAESRDEYGGNSWALSVFTPSGGINFDRMLYFPNQDYPERDFGGWLERIGDWAYVHE